MRLTDTIMGSNVAFAAGRQNQMVDLENNGMFGFAPDLTNYVTNTGYVKKNVICLLVEAPKAFSLLPNSDKWIGILRSLVELHAMSIEGLNATLEVEFSETPVGGSGQMQEDPINVTEARSNVTFRFAEKYGMPVQQFFRGWITNLIADPNSKVPNIVTLLDKPTDLLADQISATMIFIEPDPTMTKVLKSWLICNMMPKTSGENTARKDPTQASEQVTYDIPMTGVAQYGAGVDVFAQSLLDSISLTGANPQNRQAFVQAISADIQASKAGYTTEVANLAATAVQV